MKTPALSGRRRLTRTDDGVGCGVGYGNEARLSIGYTRPHRRRILGYTPRPRRRLLGQGLHTPLVGPRFGFVGVVAPTDTVGFRPIFFVRPAAKYFVNAVGDFPKVVFGGEFGGPAVRI